MALMKTMGQIPYRRVDRQKYNIGKVKFQCGGSIQTLAGRSGFDRVLDAPDLNAPGEIRTHGPRIRNRVGGSFLVYNTM